MAPVPPSLNIGLGLNRMVVGSGYSFADSDAAAYVAAIETEGATPTDDQKEAIDTFFVDAKDTGYYTSLYRLYLPIWGAAAPNAKCLVSLTSATFTGSFTHASGYVNPTSASAANQFVLNYSLLDDDATTEDAHLMGLAYDDTPPQDRGIPSANQTLIGSGSTTGSSVRINTTSSGVRPQAAWLGANESAGAIGSHGVMIADRLSGTTALHKLDGSGSSDTTNTASLTGTYSNFPLIAFGSAISGSSATQSTNAKAGALGVGLGLGFSDRVSYAGHIKTLWETCTGISL